MSMKSDCLGEDQDLLDQFLAGNPVRKKIDVEAHWAAEKGCRSENGQAAVFERLVCKGKGEVIALFPYGPSLAAMEGFGVMKWLKFDYGIPNSHKSGITTVIECRLFEGADMNVLDQYINDWRAGVDDKAPK